MKSNKLSVGIWTYGMCTERYVSSGYKPFLTFKDRIEKLKELKECSGVEINYPNDINEDNYNEILDIIHKAGLVVSVINVELVCEPQWKHGSFSSFDDRMRELAISRTKKAMDIAAICGSDTVNLWLGLDGFDYILEADYTRAWRNLVEGIRECARYREDIKLALEYKLSEPNMKCYINSAGKALALSLLTECSNVGVTLDFGHAINANENPAESAAMLMAENRLFHVHVNDNYGVADDDMPAGTVHWPQFIEFIYWLNKMGYDKWISVDIYPYRDDAQHANQLTIDFLRYAEKLIQKLDVKFYDGTEPKGMSISRLMEAIKKS
ncbi:MAG: sugar phosphate isomerase/epimerase [Clostridiales bacterium]|nr:sugar phosphate isomerase/epimerase [Clostridiales bacterium]